MSTQSLRLLVIGFFAAVMLFAGAGSAGAQSTSAKCENGMARQFPCKNVDLQSVTQLARFGGITGNDIWGWTDPKTGNEYAIIGTTLTTGFVDVTDPKNPEVVGELPSEGILPPPLGLNNPGVLWRDIKIDENFAFIVSENAGSGMQVFDLTKLRNGSANTIYAADTVYLGADDGEGDEQRTLSNSHNIAINEETDTAYLVGTNTCRASVGGETEGGGPHIVDISDPLDPTFLGCARYPVDVSGDEDPSNYTHDIDCRVYDGPDADYTGREICIGSNEDAVVIYDMTSKSSPTVISSRTYATYAYTHQGTLTPNGKYFIFGDELDENEGTVDNTTTYIVDVQDLDNPGEAMAYSHETNSIDHNLYLNRGLVYETNYGAGLRVLDYSDSLLGDGQLNELAFFDTLPGADPSEFAGVWSNYPYFASGNIIVSNIEDNANGLFVLKPTISAGTGETDGGDGGVDDGTGGTPGDGPGPDDGKGGGDDGVSCPLATNNDLRGSEDGETITGTSGNDGINAFGGNDTIIGLGGNDCLLGEDGNDVIRATKGDDYAAGGKGRDDLRGQGGSDELIGGGSKDRLRGAGGDDKLDGNKGRDTLNSGGGSDRLKGGSGRDRLRGGGGDDNLRGGKGRDVLRGGGGVNRINCGPGKDKAVVTGSKDKIRNCERVIRR